VKEAIDSQRIVLSLLQSVDQDGAQSQRAIATELGVALGLVNAYLKCCAKKGLVKVSQAPARRYAYYLTPQGFAEKARLTAEYLRHSLSFFRRARFDCTEVFSAARARGRTRLALAGVSDLAEIALLCAAEAEVTIVGIVDPHHHEETFHGVRLVADVAELGEAIDAVVVTALVHVVETHAALSAALGADRVLTPGVLGLGTPVREDEHDDRT
jgi:DNA-binding MarR family transcriptional regulator